MILNIFDFMCFLSRGRFVPAHTDRREVKWKRLEESFLLENFLYFTRRLKSANSITFNKNKNPPLEKDGAVALMVWGHGFL